MSNVHTSSVAKEAQGLFAKPSQGFCFPAVQPSLGNLGLSFAAAPWIFSRLFSCPHHPTQPTEDSGLAFWSGQMKEGRECHLEGFRGEGRNKKAHAEPFANRFLGETGICLSYRKLGDSGQVLRVKGWSAGVSVGLGGRCLGSLQHQFHFVGTGNPFTLLDEAREALRRGDKSRDHILGILLLAEARSRKFRNSWGKAVCVSKEDRTGFGIQLGTWLAISMFQRGT